MQLQGHREATWKHEVRAHLHRNEPAPPDRTTEHMGHVGTRRTGAGKHERGEDSALVAGCEVQREGVCGAEVFERQRQ